MNFKQKFFYMALGCVFTLIGYTLATLTTTTTAQIEDLVSEVTYDKITCKELLITDGEGDNKIIINPLTITVTSQYWETTINPHSISIKGVAYNAYLADGGISFLSKDDKSRATLSILGGGGSIQITDKNGTIVGRMEVGEKGGGLIKLNDQHNKSAIQLNFGDDGGHISFFNKGGENVLQAGVNEGGGGTINTNDKHGYRTGRLP